MPFLFAVVKVSVMLTYFSQGGGYMFEFDNVGNRDLCRDFVGNVHFVVSESTITVNMFFGRYLM